MEGLFKLVQEVRKYRRKEVSADELTFFDCNYLYDHGVYMQMDNRRDICILKPLVRKYKFYLFVILI